MLKVALASRGLTIVREHALSSIWLGTPDAPRYVGILFTELFGPYSVLYHYLNLSKPDASSSVVADFYSAIDEDLLADAISRISTICDHDAVNEAHAFIALCDLRPLEVERLCTSLHPAPTTPQQEAKVSDSVLRDRMQLRIEGLAARLGRPIGPVDPITYVDITRSVEEYLRSPYYPFGEPEWERYRSDDLNSFCLDDRHMLNRSLAAFAAHRIRDDWLSRGPRA